MINMGKTMLLSRQCLYIGLVLNIPIVASQTTVNGHVGQEVKIPCGVGGSYTLPQWSKGLTPLTSQNVSGVNPSYPRFSYDTDMRTLVISSALEEDSGTYECTHTGGTNSPQNSIVVITEAPTTTTPRSVEEKGFTKTTMIIVIVCSCAAAVIIVFLVLLVIQRRTHQKVSQWICGLCRPKCEL